MGVVLQVGPFVIKVAVIQVGPGAKDLDPQAGQIIDRSAKRLTFENTDLGHETCAIQSDRL